MPLTASIEESFTRRLASSSRRCPSPAARSGDRSGRGSGARVAGGGATRNPGHRLPTRSSRKTCWCLSRGWCSVIRWFVRLSTGRPPRTNDARPTARWRKRLIQNSIRIVVPGTGRNRPKSLTRRLPRNCEDVCGPGASARWLRGRRGVSGTSHGVDTRGVTKVGAGARRGPGEGAGRSAG